jgi:hypothetical protein
LIVNADVLALNELRWYENAPLKLQIQAEPAVRAAQGNEGIVETTARNTVSGSDELGFPADSFNSMADAMAGQMAVQRGVAEVIATMVSACGLKEAQRHLLECLGHR